jgi:GcrA cell cycle regulator
MPKIGSFEWTDEAVEILRQMWTVEGRPASAIAALFGITRNAVLGKVHRARMAYLHRPKTKPKAKQTRRHHPMVFAKVVGPELAELEPETPVEPVRLMDLQAHHCRWPVAGTGEHTLFCGATALSKRHSWCEKHHKMGHAGTKAA